MKSLDKSGMKAREKPMVYAMAPPFPSLAGAPASHPSQVSLRSLAELTHACCRQQALRSDSPQRALYPAHRSLRPERVPRGLPQCSLRKDGTMAFNLSCIPGGRTFPQGTRPKGWVDDSSIGRTFHSGFDAFRGTPRFVLRRRTFRYVEAEQAEGQRRKA